MKSSKFTYDKTLITSILELISGISIFCIKFLKSSIADTNVGDEVITSGMDNIFYEGLRVGKVVEIKDFPEMKIATIQPYAKPLKKRFFYTYEANNNIDNQEKSILENLEESKKVENKEQK